jgi:hypothetical protein
MRKKLILAIIIAVLLCTSCKNESKEKKYDMPENNRITIILPFTEENDAYMLNPVGEKANHPGLVGHNAIDFYWKKNVPLIASADGTITDLGLDPKTGKTYFLEFVSGDYKFVYGDLGEYNPNLSIGSKIKQGDFIAYPMSKALIGFGDDYVLHWAFGTINDGELALCPNTYFDASSKQRVDTIWAKTEWEPKKDYPLLCNGFFEGLDSFKDYARIRKQLDDIQNSNK